MRNKSHICNRHVSLMFHLSDVYTVKPPVSDHPKCQAKVVAYRVWSLVRVQTRLGQNLALLAYGNGRDLHHVLNILFMQKSIFSKKTLRNFPLILSNHEILLQHLIIQFSSIICQVVTYGSQKQKKISNF